MATVYQARDASAPFRAEQRRKVRVGGRTITAAEIAREVQNHEAPTPLEGWRAAARALAVRELLLQEAKRLGLTPDPREDDDGRRETDEEAQIRAAAETQVVTLEPDDTTCRRYYERNTRRFRSADLFEAAHILLPARPDDVAARAAARDAAARLIATLQDRPDAFAALAARHSACPSAGAGGNLGQLKRGDTVHEFDAALAALQPGAITAAPVETRYGVHVLRLERRIDGRQLPYELVAPRVAEYLAERSRRIATAQYLAVLAARTGVEGVELPSPGDVGAMN